MRSMPRIAQIAVAVLAGALLAGGGYALAANSTKTIHGCVVNSTHQLLIQKRCHRGQHTLTWNQRGPTGQVGATGPAGGASDWAVIGTSQTTGIFSGKNISAQRIGVGEYEISAGGACATASGAISVIPEIGTPAFSTSNYPIVQTQRVSGTFSDFNVQVDNDAAGTLTPEDGLTLDVTVTCQ